MELCFLFPPLIKSRCQGTILWACLTQHNCFLIYFLGFSALVERPFRLSSSNPLDFLQFPLGSSLSLPFFLSVWLCSLVRLLVLVLSWQVYEIEFYKANKHKNLHREKEALIELSNTNLPRDSVWQKLIRSTECLCLRDCLTASNCLSLWLSCNLSVISATIITRISGCFHGPWTNI